MLLLWMIRVHHPELRLKEGLKEIARCLDESKTSMAAELAEALWTDCFATEKTLLGGQIGRYNREWAKKTRPHMEKLLGKNGRSLSVKSVATAREWIANNFAVVPGRHGITKDMKARLVDFAEWLDEFDHTKARLELPGQYDTCTSNNSVASLSLSLACDVSSSHSHLLLH